ncbi:MAG TPA: M23 family metallopeptidase, partial [Longimicrobiales bacterium]
AGPPPRLLEHRVTYRGVGEAAGRRASVRGARVAVRTEPPVVLSPPVRGGPWAAVYEPSWERGHRRVVYTVDGHARIPGRFAIDWIKLDAEGRCARGDEDEVAGWLGYGADVLAVADAVVVAVRDDVPESATLSGHPDHPLEDATGNYIALDLGGGRFAFYEHLKPGSIRVRAGDRVRRGAVIAAVGFTGHTTGPHLHFHVADAASPLGAEGVPFVLDRFRLLGRYDDFGAFGRAPWTPIDSAGSVRREEMPAPNVVVDFGGAAASTGPPDRTAT